MPHNPAPNALVVSTIEPKAAEAAKEPLRLIRATDLGAPKPADYVVKGLLNRGDLALIFGKAGCGKSLFAAHLFYRVAQRADHCYGKRVRGGPVIYVCLEGQGGFRRRIQGLEHEHGPAEDFYLVEQPFNLVDPKASALIDSLIEQSLEIKPVAIVIDTWAQATGGDENGSEANSKALATINRLRTETGALVCCIDHTGWGEDAQKRPRGWSGKWAATDTGLRLKGDIKNDDVLVVPERLKDGTDYTPLSFGSKRIDLGVDLDGDPIEIFSAVEREESDAKAAENPKKNSSRSLTATEEGDLKAICEALGKDGYEREVNGEKKQVISRNALRNALVAAERLDPPVTVTSDGKDGHATDPTNKLRQQFRRCLRRLKDKGKIDFDKQDVWRAFNEGEVW